MKIDEAVKIAMEQDAFIRRKNELSGKVLIKPTNREVKKIEKMKKELDGMTIEEINAFAKKEAKKAKIYSYIVLTLSVIPLILRIIILLVK